MKIENLWLVLPPILFGVVQSLTPITPVDLWWHLAQGRIIFETTDIPTQNLFLYTSHRGEPFVDLPWLSEWLLYSMWDVGRHQLLSLFENSIPVVVGLLLSFCTASRCNNRRLIGLFVAVGLVASFFALEIRSRIFVLCLFVGYLFVLLRVLDRRLSINWLWAAVPLTLMWQNLHGSFLLVPVLLLIAVLAEAFENLLKQKKLDKRRFMIGLLSGGLSFLTPIFHPLGFKKVYGKYVERIIWDSRSVAAATEWQPLAADGVYGAFVTGLILLSLFLVYRARDRISVPEVALFASTLMLQLMAIRMIFWWVVVSVMILPKYVGGSILPISGTKQESPLERRMNVGIVAVLSSIFVALQFGPFIKAPLNKSFELGFKANGAGEWSLSRDTPIELVEGINPGARIFHSQYIGGLINFKVGARVPDRPTESTFIDQRLSLSDMGVWRDYWTISQATRGWRQRLERWNIDVCLLNKEDQAPLIDTLTRRANWKKVRSDHAHTLFTKGTQDSPNQG